MILTTIHIKIKNINKVLFLDLNLSLYVLVHDQLKFEY